MNLFEKAIREGRILREEDLKKCFWKLAKKVHPDLSSMDANHWKFIKLKEDYDASIALLRHHGGEAPKHEAQLTRKQCLDLFKDLLASNFPVDPSIKDSIKIYKLRIERLNAALSAKGENFNNLFLAFEKEMYELRNPSIVANHPYNVVRMYLYRFCDYTYFPNPTNRHYLQSSYDLVFGILKSRHLEASIRFINWLLEDILS